MEDPKDYAKSFAFSQNLLLEEHKKTEIFILFWQMFLTTPMSDTIRN